MHFDSETNFNYKIKNLNIIGFGSQGTCFHNTCNNKVYKIFNCFLEDDDIFKYYHEFTYRKEDIMRFSNIKNDTFFWAEDVITLNNKVIGYVTNYTNAKPLHKKIH